MATVRVNGVELYYELHGTGSVPLAVVHGSWDSHGDFDLLVPQLTDAFRILVYDRRGHSRSERPPGQGSVREDVADLAALVEHLGLAPAWVLGNSFGACIALRLAGERPDLARGLLAHEPPLVTLLAGDPALAPLLEAVRGRIAAVVERIAGGDHEGAAEQFVDTVAVGPGSWAGLTPELRQTFVQNAPTFLDEAGDPEALALDLDRVRRFPRPMLLTLGGQSPPMFAPIVAKLAAALPDVEVLRLADAGHVPHATHPEAYAAVVMEFVRRHAAADPES